MTINNNVTICPCGFGQGHMHFTNNMPCYFTGMALNNNGYVCVSELHSNLYL
jgi:hypothetical protein